MEHAHGPGHCDCHASVNDADPFGSDLIEYISLDTVLCFNESSPNSSRNVFRPLSNKLHPQGTLESYAGDPELLLCVPFVCPVKLMSICVIGCGNGTSPGRVRLIKDKNNIDLNSAGSTQSTQDFDLLENLNGEVEYMTRVSRFNNTSKLWLHFPSCTGGDRIAISFIGFKGESSGIARPRAFVGVYEAKPMQKDHQAFDDTLGSHKII